MFFPQLLKTVLYKGGLEPPEGCFQGVGELISKCLQKDIAKRPNAKEIVRDLGKVMHECKYTISAQKCAK